MNRVIEYMLISVAALAALAAVAGYLYGWIQGLAAEKVRVDVHDVRVVASTAGTYVTMFIENSGNTLVCVKRVIVSWGSGSIVLGDGDPRELAPSPCIAPGSDAYYAGWQGGEWPPVGPVALTLVLSTPGGEASVSIGAVAVEEEG